MWWIKSTTLQHYSLDFSLPKLQNLKDKNTDKVKKKMKERKRKWHWGLGLMHIYSRLMVDFISNSHCYAISVLQQNEYCILTGSVCIYYVALNEYLHICSSVWFILYSLSFKKKKNNYILSLVKLVKAFQFIL